MKSLAANYTKEVLMLAMMLLAGCTGAMETDGGRAQIPTPTRIAGYTVTPTLFPVAIEATSSAQAKMQVGLELEKIQSTRNAQATVNAGGVNATLTMQAAGVAAASTMVFAGPEATRGHLTGTAAKSTQNYFETRAAYPQQATATQVVIDRANTEWGVGLLWEALKLLAVTALVMCGCMVILWVGRAHRQKIEADNLQKTWSILMIGATPHRLQWNFGKGEWEFTPLVIENPKQLDSGAEERLKKEQALMELVSRWQESILLAAQAASITGTWAVSVMSNRAGALGIMSEDALKDIVDVLVEEDWLVSGAGGTKWVEGRGGFLGLRAAMKAGEFRFALPLSGDGSPKPAPAIEIGNATPQPQRGQGRQRKSVTA